MNTISLSISERNTYVTRRRYILGNTRYRIYYIRIGWSLRQFPKRLFYMFKKLRRFLELDIFYYKMLSVVSRAKRF